MGPRVRSIVVSSILVMVLIVCLEQWPWVGALIAAADALALFGLFFVAIALGAVGSLFP